VDPTVDSHFVSVGSDVPLLVGMQEGNHGRHEEARSDVLAAEKPKDLRHSNPILELALGNPADRLAAIAKLAGFVIAVERKRHGAASPARPLARAQTSTGADLANDMAPLLLRPLPWFQPGFRERPFMAGCMLVHPLSPSPAQQE
jgi:hypothetical protein